MKESRSSISRLIFEAVYSSWPCLCLVTQQATIASKAARQYWLPQDWPPAPILPNVICVDYSAGKGGPLVAYSLDPESASKLPFPRGIGRSDWQQDPFRTTNDRRRPFQESMSRIPPIFQQRGLLPSSAFVGFRHSEIRQVVGYPIRAASLGSFLKQRRSALQALDCSLGNLRQLSRPNRNIPVYAATAIRLVLSV